MDDRLRQGFSFLSNTDWADSKPHALAGDASTRRYFRLTRKDGQSAMLMDAPAEHDQDTKPFALVANILSQGGLNPPQIIEADHERGFLLLEDFGDDVFARVINKDPNQEMTLYRHSIEVLISLDKLALPQSLPVFTTDHMAEMIAPVYDWYRNALVGDAGDARPAQAILRDVMSLNRGRSVSLRDFHAENLIWLPNRDGLKKVGLLDFQDAMIGPRGYDLVSLLMDARRDVSVPVHDAMIDLFAKETNQDTTNFLQTYAAIGVQRNLRILGIFVRLAVKMGRTRYLDFLPRVWRYVETGLAHPSLKALADQVFADLPAPTPELIEGLKIKCRTNQTPS